MNESTVRTLLLVGAAYHLALGGYFLLAPGSAYDTIAEFPPRNDHFLRDVSSFYLAFGLAFWVASRRPTWRAPVLALVAVQYAIHTVVHVFDVGKAATDAKGVFAAVSLGLITAALIFVLGAHLGGRRRIADEIREREATPASADPAPADPAPAMPPESTRAPEDPPPSGSAPSDPR